jgi:predicted nucleic acid-binding protein
MKAYWDSSALVEAASDFALRTRLRQERGITRTHALAEIFSALTGGNLAIRLEADAAAEMVDNLAQDLDFVDLTAKEVLAALKRARKRGVRRGRVHDFLHAIAAENSGAEELLTTDQYDFESLTDSVRVELI